MKPSTLREVSRFGPDARPEPFDRVVVEEPLEIRANGEPVAVTMRTPGDDRELAAGFLFTEGVAQSPDDLRAIEQVAPNVVDVTLAEGVDASPAKRALYASSSCGLCGKASIAAITVRLEPIDDPTSFELDRVLAMVEAMRTRQSTFERTGGLHAAALFTANGALVEVREDVGRHNATDKVIGRALLDRRALSGHALLVSGRAGFEIVQKAAVARIPLVAAISAPSSLAIDLAERAGVTLIGFLRPPHASVYTHRERVR